MASCDSRSDESEIINDSRSSVKNCDNNQRKLVVLQFKKSYRIYFLGRDSEEYGTDLDVEDMFHWNEIDKNRNQRTFSSETTARVLTV